MSTAAHRVFKNHLYGLFARIGKALSNPHRLEMLELLAQGERTVDSLASEMGVSVANASQHLQALRQAALVESRKDGLFVHYRLAAPGVFELSKAIRTVAEDRLADLDRLVREHFADRDDAGGRSDWRAAEASSVERDRHSGRQAGERVRRRPHPRRDFRSRR